MSCRGSFRPASRSNMKVSYLSLVYLVIFLFLRYPELLGQTVGSAQSTRATLSPGGGANSQLTSQIQNDLAVYHKEQQALAGEYGSLVESGASAQQIQAWMQNNAARLRAQAQRAQSMSQVSASATLPTSGIIRVPSGLSPTTTDFVNGQAALAQAFSSAHSRMTQNAGGAGATVSSAQIARVDNSALQAYLQQNASLLSQQRQRAAAMAAYVSQRTPDAPSTLAMPAGLSQGQAEYLQTRNQLWQRFVQFQKQYATADPSIRATAFEEWRRKNIALIEQLQSQAQNLAQASPNN